MKIIPFWKYKINIFIIIILMYMNSFSFVSAQNDLNKTTKPFKEGLQIPDIPEINNNNQDEYILDRYIKDGILFEDADSIDEEENLKFLLNTSSEKLKDYDYAIFTSKTLFNYYIKLFFEYKKLDRLQKKTNDELIPLKERYKTTPFPQNLRMKNQIEKMNAELHQIVDEIKKLEKEGINVVKFFYNNSEQISIVIEQDLNNISNKINSYKLKSGKHIERLLQQIEKGKIMLELISKIKNNSDIIQKEAPFELVKEPIDLISDESKKIVIGKVENRLTQLEKELNFLNTRIQEIQKQVEEIRELIYNK